MARGFVQLLPNQIEAEVLRDLLFMFISGCDMPLRNSERLAAAHKTYAELSKRMAEDS